jgi:hypothetical protein
MNDYDAAFKAALGGGSGETASPYDEAFSAAMPSPEKTAPQFSPEPVGDFSGNLRVGSFDTGIALPESVNRRLAQFGSGTADLIQGAKQRLGMADEGDTAFKRGADKQLNSDFAGKALSFLGKTAPGFAIPFVGSAPILSGIAGGAIYGALEPTGKGESAAFNTALGGGLGAVLPAAVSGFRALSKPADGLAEKAINQYGIPLTVADISGSKSIKATKSILDSLPVTGSVGAAQAEAKQAAFNAAVGKTFGAKADKLTPDVMTKAKNDIRNELNRVWNNNTLKIDGPFVQKLQDIGARAENLNPEQQARIGKQIQNLLAKVDKNGEIPGNFANNWQSEMRLMAEGEKGLEQSILSDLRQTAIHTFNRSVTGADAKALSVARGQYGAMKTLEPIMNKAEGGVAGRVSGDVPAALLPGAAVTQYGNRLSQSPFADLSPIAGRFMVDRTPQTGGSLRALMQNGMVGGAMTAGGAALNLPATAGALGLGLAGQAGLGSTMARKMLERGIPRGLLDSPELMPALREAARLAAMRAPIGAGMGLLSAPALE